MHPPEFWYSPESEEGLLPVLLAPLGALYAAGGQLRRACTKPKSSPMPVICVGNLTAGGTGKTPVALAIAAKLAARGQSPVFLTRGYGGRAKGPLFVHPIHHMASEVGDEALLLARKAPTILARRRSEAIGLAPPNGIIVMDDGFQNPTLAKDLSFLIIDGEKGLGNGRVIPAGPLRESASDGLARADALVVAGKGELPASVARIWGAKPVLRFRLVVEQSACEALAGRKLVAFAGIGRPDKFFKSLTELGAVVTATQSFADHHVYSEHELAELKAKAAAERAMLVTTEKDWVRLPANWRENVTAVPVTAIFEQPTALDALLDRITR